MELRVAEMCEGRVGGRVAWSSSCSRNAHDRNVLVRRAQSRIDQATPPERKTSKLGRSIIVRRWTRAVEDQPGHSFR